MPVIRLWNGSPAVVVGPLETDDGPARGFPVKVPSGPVERKETAATQAEVNMDDDEIIGPTLPHSSFGDPDCCGCLNGIIRGEQADIVCNECGQTIRTVPAADLQRVLDQMELSLDVACA
jgi:hypothetical protein